MVSQFVVVFNFNLDRKDPIVYSGTPGEYFGYAVALHAQRGGNKWVIVGAPLGNKTSNSVERNRYGTVFKCHSDSTNCDVISLDDRDPEKYDYKGSYLAKEEITGQWLGASIANAPSSEIGDLLVCAPRYSMWGNRQDPPQDRNRLLLGKCFLVRNDLTGMLLTFQPCYDFKTDNNGNSRNYEPNNDGVCEAGLSAAVSSNGYTQSYLVGLPGRFTVDGSIAVFFSDSDPQEPLRTSHAQVKGDYGIATGYAVAIGSFNSPNSEDLEFLASSTRAEELNGKVTAFYYGDTNLEIRFTLPLPENVQKGSNFGHSLCAVDLNNDSYSDLLVSAPYHGQDEGRVYVYMNNGKTPGTLSHVPALTLEGPKLKRALFGFAMAVAGDLNRDGYPDVAISAPYGGNDQGGAVYIYFGERDGIETSPRQVIQGSDISPGVKTFGHSLAGGQDVDGNSYSDLAIGAYSSDKAFLLRSRPIVDMEGKITLSPTEISLEDNDTVRRASDGVSRKSIDVTVCLKFKNQLAKSSFGPANVTYSIELEKSRLEEPLRRIFFLQNNKTSFIITRQVSLARENQWYCQFKHTVYLREKEQILSVSDPLTFDLVFDLAHSPSCKLCPILNDYNDIAQRSRSAEVNFIKQCGPDKICEPDLSVKGQVRFDDNDPSEHNELRVGEDSEMIIRVVAENKAQDSAYPGQVIVTYPSIIDYSSSNQGVLCRKAKGVNGDETTAMCVVGNPFGQNAKKQFDIRFDTQRVTGNISELVIHLEATSPGKEANPSDNMETITVAVKFEADLEISGTSRPDQVVYSDKASEVKDLIGIGPSVKHVITVRNNGPSPVEYADVTIMVPFKNKSVEDPNFLLYLNDVQVLGNAGSCNIKTNPLNLQLRNNSSPTDQAPESNLEKPKRGVVPVNEELPCESDTSLICLKVPCYLGRMKGGNEVQIQIAYRLWQNTLIKAEAGSVSLITTAKVVPSSSVPESQKDNNEVKIPLIANPTTTPTSKRKTAIWIYVVSALGGLALLAIAGIALYKCGFFKRKNLKTDHAEEELTPMRTLEPEAAPVNV